jgi:hypothetical protein
MSGGQLGNAGRGLGRTVRGLRPDRNPLRRRSDRLEAWLLGGLFAAAAAATPFAAGAASRAAYQSALQARQHQLATRYQVRAVLSQDAGAADGYSLADHVLVQASWTSVGGVRRSGEIPARPGSLPSDVVPLWTDRNGYLVSPPLDRSAVAGSADAAAAGTVAAATAGWLAAAAVSRRLLNRRRLTAWEADWLVTAPTWNRQRW